MDRRKLIKKDLLKQLNDNGVRGNHYVDLIEDYMSMWDIKNQLIENIQEKGVSIRYQNGENQFGYKKNDSISELNRTNRQMLTILNDLGLKAADIKVVDNDDEFEL